MKDGDTVGRLKSFFLISQVATLKGHKPSFSICYFVKAVSFRRTFMAIQTRYNSMRKCNGPLRCNTERFFLLSVEMHFHSWLRWVLKGLYSVTNSQHWQVWIQSHCDETFRSLDRKLAWLKVCSNVFEFQNQLLSFSWSKILFVFQNGLTYCIIRNTFEQALNLSVCELPSLMRLSVNKEVLFCSNEEFWNLDRRWMPLPGMGYDSAKFLPQCII